MVSKIQPPTAGDFMHRDVVTAPPEMGLEELTLMLLHRGVSNAPVVVERDHRKDLVGFISERDCLEFLSNEFFYKNPDVKVGSMMKKHPVCVAPDTDIFTLASIFIQHGYRHLPVVEGAELTGIVSRRDALQGLYDYYNACSKEEAEARWPPDIKELVNLRFMVK